MSSESAAKERVVTRLVGTGGEVLAKVTERARQLQAINFPGVLAPVGLGVGEGEQVVVRVPWLDGVDLAELETRRGPLNAGECVWLGVRLAQALDRMHAHGVAHGDISPGNVVLVGDRVVLVDTVSGCLEDEYGTVGFRAPEREVDGATTAGDVYSLGSLLRWCVADSQRVAVEAWTAPLLDRSPQARPPVAVAGKALTSCATEQPVVVPARSELVTAVRARATDRTIRLERGRGQRWRRLGLRVGLGVAIVAVLGAMAVAVPRLIEAAKPAGASAATASASAAQDGTVGVTASPEPVDSPGPAISPASDPGQAALALTEQRFTALAAGDSAQLLATVGDGPLADQVTSLAAAIAQGDVSYDGLMATMGEAQVVAQLPDSAVVHVAYEVSEHVVTTEQGPQHVAAHSQHVELELSWDGQWTVKQARPIP